MKKKKLPTDEPSIIAGISGIVVLIILVGLLVYCWPAIDIICSAARVHLNKFVATANAETLDANDTFDTNDIKLFDSPLIDKAIFIQFTCDANTLDEAASELRNMDTRNAKEVIDIEVTIGDETHTASFEDFFEWMGFGDKPEFCITKFGDGTVEEMDFISPDDPNCLITLDEFLFKLIGEL